MLRNRQLMRIRESPAEQRTLKQIAPLYLVSLWGTSF